MYEFDHASGSSGLESSIRDRRAARDGWPFPGRHESHAEIEEETPIFHALTVGGWRERQRTGRAGNAVRRVHRGTLRATRPAGASRQAAAAVAAFHTDAHVAPRPAQPEAAGAEAVGAVPALLQRRRDAERAADRAAIAGLLGGAGRHRLPRSA